MVTTTIMPQYVNKIDVNLFIVFVIFVFSYLIGSFSLSYIIGKYKGINLKENGSKNLGASNTLALIGKRAGLFVLVSDVLKGCVAVLLSFYLTDILYDFVGNIYILDIFKIPLNEFYRFDFNLGFSAFGVILGHIFPFYLRFKGGKGFATYLGVLLAFSFIFNRNGLIIIVMIGILLSVITDYIVVATFTIILCSPIYLFLAVEPVVGFNILFSSLVVFYKHRENIVNIKTGKEMKIRSAFKNKYKMKK